VKDKAKKNISKMNTTNIISNLEHKSNPATPRKQDMKYESSSDMSISNSAKSSARGTKKTTINWRDYFIVE